MTIEGMHMRKKAGIAAAAAAVGVLAIIGVAVYLAINARKPEEKQQGYQPPVQATPEHIDYAQPQGNTSMHFTRDSLGNIRFRPKTNATATTTKEREAQKATTPPGASSSDLAKPGYDLVGLRTQGNANLTQPAKSTQRRSLTLGAREYACFRAGDDLFHTHRGGLMTWVYLPKARGTAVIASLGNIATGKQVFCLKYAHGEGLCVTIYDHNGDENAKAKAPGVDLMDNAWHLVGFMLDAPGLRLYNDGMEVAFEDVDTTLESTKGGANTLCINRSIKNRDAAIGTVPVMYVSNLTFWRKPLGPIPISAYYGNGQEELLDPADIVTDPDALGAWWKLSDREGSALPASATAPGFKATPGKVLSRTQAGRAVAPTPSSSPTRDVVYAKQWAVVAFAKGAQANAAQANAAQANAAQANAAQANAAVESPYLVDYLRPHPTLIAQQTRESTLMSENSAATEIVVNVDTQPKHNNNRLDRDAWQPGEIAVKAPQSFVY